jgi:hypothetical protein
MYVGVDMTEKTKHHDSDARRQEKKRSERKSIGSILSNLDFGIPQLLVPVPVSEPSRYLSRPGFPGPTEPLGRRQPGLPAYRHTKPGAHACAFSH